MFVIIDPSLLFISWPVKCLLSSLNPPRPRRPGCVFAECISLVPDSCVCLCMLAPTPCWSLHPPSPPTFTLHPTLLFLKVSYLPRPPILLLPSPLTPTVPLSCLPLNPPWWSVLLTPAERRRNGVVTAVTKELSITFFCPAQTTKKRRLSVHLDPKGMTSQMSVRVLQSGNIRAAFALVRSAWQARVKM